LLVTSQVGTPLHAQESGREDGADEGGAVIVPGKEQLLAQMLGLGADLPAECSFAGGDIDRTFVHGKYTCPGGEVVLDVRHVDAGKAPVATTAKFAISIVSGSAPAGLVDAVAAQIRAREAEFEWKWIEPPQKPLSQTNTMLIGSVGIALAAIVGFVLRRRKRPTET